MIRELVTDEAILSTPCTPATVEDAELAADLIETLRATEDGCCLAANQVGVTRSVAVYLDDDGEAHVLYNPKLLFGIAATQTVEGCLTREEPSKVRRFQKVRVTYDEIVDGALKQRRREFVGWEAQMVQHMIDHCRGRYVSGIPGFIYPCEHTSAGRPSRGLSALYLFEARKSLPPPLLIIITVCRWQSSLC